MSKQEQKDDSPWDDDHEDGGYRTAPKGKTKEQRYRRYRLQSLLNLRNQIPEEIEPYLEVVDPYEHGVCVVLDANATNTTKPESLYARSYVIEKASGKTTKQGAQMIVELAKASGWAGVKVNNKATDEFKMRVWRACQENGLDYIGKPPSKEVMAAFEEDQQIQKTEAANAIQAEAEAAEQPAGEEGVSVPSQSADETQRLWEEFGNNFDGVDATDEEGLTPVSDEEAAQFKLDFETTPIYPHPHKPGRYTFFPSEELAEGYFDGEWYEIKPLPHAQARLPEGGNLPLPAGGPPALGGGNDGPSALPPGSNRPALPPGRPGLRALGPGSQ